MITDYILEIDGGSLSSSFTPLATYDYSVNGFSFPVDRVANSLTTGNLFRFKYQAINAMGPSLYSDSIRIGLGPLPSTPSPPTKSSLYC